MDAAIKGTGPKGVGIAHHPFLHAALLAAPESYDFVEFSLERYLDEAQRGLLDPDLARVRALAALKPVTWRSDPTAGACAGAGRAAALLRETGAALLRRGPAPDSGTPPGDDAPRILALPLSAIVEGGGANLPPGGVRSLGVDLGAADLSIEPGAAVRALSRLPSGSVVDVAVEGGDARAWPLLDAVLGVTGSRRVVVRRLRSLFPMRDVFADLDRARAALCRCAAGVPAASAEVCPAAAADHPAVPAKLQREARRVWAEGVSSLHAARQLAQWMERRQPGRIAR